MLAPFTEAVEMSRQFLENTLIWICPIAVTSLAIPFLIYRRLVEERSIKAGEESE
jgi:hypothetical protein